MVDPSFWSLVVLCLTALLAGAINSIAGGGTLLTFPALVAALARGGLPGAEAAVLANATSCVALVPGSLAGAWGYRRQTAAMRHWLVLLAGPSIVGGALGALLLIRLDPRYFERIVPWLLLAAALLFLKETLRPSRRPIRPRDEQTPARAAVGLMFFQLLVGLYGGYFGAGIGILMLSALALMRLGDIYSLNALKNLLACGINGVSVAIFIAEGRVVWRFAAPMAVAAIVGGYLGAKLSLRVKPQYVRWLVVAIGFGLAIYFFANSHGGDSAKLPLTGDTTPTSDPR